MNSRDDVVLKLPRLGYGTASLLGRLTRSESVRLIEAAVEHGVRYFDTARMYGSGETESLFRSLSPAAKHSLIIATKAGIAPPSRRPEARLTRRLVGLANKIAPAGLKGAIRAPAFASPRFNQFRGDQIRASVETSLRELDVERLDVLLLHEIQREDAEKPEVAETLDQLRREGKVGAIGIATSATETVEIAKRVPSLARLRQTPSSFWEGRPPQAADDGSRTIIHSILGGRFHDFRRKIGLDSKSRQRVSEQLGGDASDASFLARAFLAHALESNADGLVLFASNEPRHIVANMSLLDKPEEMKDLASRLNICASDPANAALFFD